MLNTTLKHTSRDQHKNAHQMFDDRPIRREKGGKKQLWYTQRFYIVKCTTRAMDGLAYLVSG